MKAFDILKKKKGWGLPLTPKSQAKAPKFILRFNAARAYLDIRDDNGRLFYPDYRNFTGQMRKLLRTIYAIKKELEVRVDWENDSLAKQIPLGENDYILDLMKPDIDLFDASGKKLVFSEKTAHIEINIPPRMNASGKKQKYIRCTVRLLADGMEIASSTDFQILSERFVLSDGVIYEIKPIGENFEALPVFHTSISFEDLYNYIALACSSFTNIQIRYGDYGIREGRPLEATPCIIFEDVDAFHALRLSVSSTIQGFSPAFLNEYDINTIGEINDFERVLIIREVIYDDEDIQSAINFIRRALLKHRKKLSTGKAKDFYQDGTLFIIEPELASSFLYGELEGLLERFTLFGTEKLRSYKIRPATNPRLTLNLSHGIDFLEGDGTVEIEGQEFSLAELLRDYRKKGYVKLNDGTNVILERNYIKRLQRLFNVSEDKVKISFFDLPLVDELIEEKVSSSSLPQARKIFMGFNAIADAKVEFPNINGSLRSYQKYGFKWLRYLHEHGLGGCLADDMGLGKTIQAITLMGSVRKESKKPSLVVMPRTLLFNWEREIKKFCPEISVYTWYGATRDMSKAIEHDVILTSYGLVRSNIEIFKQEKFFYVILDESQHIKNVNFQISRAIMLLDCEHRLALSGTPLENNLWEIFSLFRFLNPGMFPSQQAFARDYVDPIQNHNDETAIRELRKKIYPFILRRLKEDVLPDLPSKVEQILYVEMSQEQKRLYEERRIFFKQAIREQVETHGIEKSQFFILQALSELRQLASVPETRTDGTIFSPKCELLMEHIEDAISNNRKILIFANFLSAIETISSDLSEAGIPFLSMTGATRNRKQLVDRFQNDPDLKIFLMTLKTGGIGLNLTAADTIFIYDPWWNLAAENQAIDRTHRIGQTKNVHCYRLICKNTIEEKILELQKKKQKLFESIVSKDQGAVKHLTMSDIDFILA